MFGLAPSRVWGFQGTRVSGLLDFGACLVSGSVLQSCEYSSIKGNV